MLTVPTVDVLMVLIGLNWYATGDGGAGQIVDLVAFQKERVHDVVPDDFEMRVVPQMVDVGPTAGKEVVDADHFLTVIEQPLAQMTGRGIPHRPSPQ